MYFTRLESNILVLVPQSNICKMKIMYLGVIILEFPLINLPEMLRI